VTARGAVDRTKHLRGDGARAYDLRESRSVIPLVGLLFTIHNAEEAIAFPLVRLTLPSWIPKDVAHSVSGVSQAHFLAALAFVTVIALVVVGWAYLRPTPGSVWAALLVQSLMLVNVGAHLITAVLVTRDYAPGLASAVLLNLPFSIYLLRKAKTEQWLSSFARRALIPTALVLHGPGIVGAYAATSMFGSEDHVISSVAGLFAH
jgi:hypothetical protein